MHPHAKTLYDVAKSEAAKNNTEDVNIARSFGSPLPSLLDRGQ
jgi:hypothetical protein